MKSTITRTFVVSNAMALTLLLPGFSMAQVNSHGPLRNDASQYDADDRVLQQDQRADPPSRVGRLSVMQGNVSYQAANVQDFSAAEVNYPLTSGDRLYTDAGARAEVEAGQIVVRIGPQTDFTVTGLSEDYAQFGLAQGSIHVRAYALNENNGSEVDTPNASVTLLRPGDTRIDVFPQDNVTVVCVLSGRVRVDAEGVQQVLQSGQCETVRGLNPARAESTRRPRVDDLDRFSGQRDALYQQAFSSESGYVGPDTIGAGDLASYGDWRNDNDYGAVWYPRGLEADWSPYSNGHWVSIAPWGWTWVGAEPWGFCPFHYGRWAHFGPRWGWIPGPIIVRPVYSPALVIFLGGSGGYFDGRSDLAAWFPLGPQEVYRPWYRSSTVYVNRVNVTNIYNVNTVEVRSIYNDRRDVYAGRERGRRQDDAHINYVNRSLATVAMPQGNFGSGRPVRDSALRLNTPETQRQLQNAPVTTRPPVAAPVEQTAGALPPRTLPARVQRPILEQRGVASADGARAARDGFNGYGGVRTNGGDGPGNRDRDFSQRNPQVPVAVAPGQTPPAVQATRESGNQNGFGGRNDGRANNDGRSNNNRGGITPPPAPATEPNRLPVATEPVAPIQPGLPNRNIGYPGTYRQLPQRQREDGVQDQRLSPPARVIVEHPAVVQDPQLSTQPTSTRTLPQRQNDEQQRQVYEQQQQRQQQALQIYEQQRQQRQNLEQQQQQRQSFEQQRQQRQNDEQQQQQQRHNYEQQQQQRQNYEQQQRQNVEVQRQQRQAQPAPPPPPPQRQSFEQPRMQPAPQQEAPHQQQAAQPSAAQRR